MHTFEHCISFRRLFDEKQKAGRVLFQKGGAVSINELPFPKHQVKSKGHMMMTSSIKRDVEGDVTVQPEASEILTGCSTETTR